MSQVNTILIVDDEPIGREVLAALLQPQGYQLLLAGNGQEALEQAAAHLPDLILLDVMMPGIDGFEVCRQLRDNPRLGEVPVIMLTALDDRASRLQGIEAGADDFISKPFDRVELRARVRTIVRLNRYRRLLAERSRFDWVVEQADDGYLIAGETGNLLYANPRARLYLGIAPVSGAIKEAFLELAVKQYHCEPQADWAAWTAPSIEAMPHYLIRPPAPNAEQFMLQVDLIEMPARQDERYLIRLRDITMSIVNQNAVWSFQGLIRHKLNTALSQVIGALDLIEGLHLYPNNSQGGAMYEIALRGAMHLQSELLDIFQYIETSNLVNPERGRCRLADLPALLSEICANLSLPSIQVGYVDVGDPASLWLAISRHGIELALGELIENARKFHPQQSPTIEIVLAHAGDALHIHVCDDGQTLSPEQLAKVWQPYYQGERFFTGQLAGMGLGLPMVAALLWRIGGRCRIYNRNNQPGVGVELIVPLAQNDETTHA